MTTTNVIAIHQPNYCPWLGYFFKIYASDVFVFLDDVQFAKEGLTKRTFIRKNAQQCEKRYLTIPVKKSLLQTDIVDVEIDFKRDWVQLHLENLRQIYRHAPYFDDYFPFVSTLLLSANQYDKLADFNINCVQQIADLLHLKTVFYRSSELAVQGAKFEYIKGLIDHFDATTYLSGTGARSYNEDVYFEKTGKQLIYNAFFPFLENQKYLQQQGDFLNGLSILDALFNVGVEGIRELFVENEKKIF